MIDPFDLLQSLCGSVNVWQGGHVRPHRNFIDWVYTESISLFEEKFRDWEKSQKVTDDLSAPFLTSVNIPVTKENAIQGLAPMPADYGHFSSARFIRAKTKDGKDIFLPSKRAPCCNADGTLVDKNCKPSYITEEVWEAMKSQSDAEEIKKDEEDIDFGTAFTDVEVVTIDKVDNGSWTSVLEHRFERPTLALPKMTQYAKGFYVSPGTVGVITVDYLRKPKKPTFIYSVKDGDPQTGDGDYIIYDKKNSTPLEWTELVYNEFLIRLEKKYGKLIREEFVWQTSESDRTKIS